jgi:hypothetical protein
MDSLVQEAMSAVLMKDWDSLRLKLHPYVRWTLPSGRVAMGRNSVLAMLAKTDPPREPASHAVRDGQIYRWTDSGEADGRTGATHE